MEIFQYQLENVFPLTSAISKFWTFMDHFYEVTAANVEGSDFLNHLNRKTHWSIYFVHRKHLPSMNLL
jgi:hypothetical protein